MKLLVIFFFIIFNGNAYSIKAEVFLNSCPIAKVNSKLMAQAEYERKQDQSSAFSSLNPTLSYGYSNNDFGNSQSRVRYGIQFNHINPFTIANRYKSAKYLAKGSKNQLHHLTREARSSKAQMLFEWIARYQLYKDMGFVVDLKRPEVKYTEISKEQLKELFIEDSYIEDLRINKNKLITLTEIFSHCGSFQEIKSNPLNITLPKPSQEVYKAIISSILEQELKIINSFCDNESLGNLYLKREKDKLFDPGLFVGFNKVEPERNEDYNELRVGVRVNINLNTLSYSKPSEILTQCDLNKDKMIITEKRAYDAALAKQERIPQLNKAMDYMRGKVTGFKVAYVNNKLPKKDIGSFINQYTIILFKLSENLSNAYSTYLTSKY